MTLFAMNAAALFVPRDSPLSQVELLAPDWKPYCKSQHDNFARDRPPSKETPQFGYVLGEHQRKVGAGSTGSANGAVVDSSATQQSDAGLHWVPLRSEKELERHLSVCTTFCFMVSVIANGPVAKRGQRFRAL